MEKTKYYISVQARTIMDHQGDAAYEFDIIASAEEMEQLVELFEDLNDVDEQSLLRGVTPGIPYHHDEVNDDYDANLIQIYQLIYSLGTQSTKAHIREMRICSLP